MAITPEALAELKQLRQDSGATPDADAPVFGVSMSQISRRVDGMAKGSWKRLFWPIPASRATSNVLSDWCRRRWAAHLRRIRPTSSAFDSPVW